MPYEFATTEVPDNTSTAVNPFDPAIRTLTDTWDEATHRSGKSITFHATAAGFAKARRQISAAAKAQGYGAVVRPIAAPVLPAGVTAFPVTMWITVPTVRKVTAEAKAKAAAKKARLAARTPEQVAQDKADRKAKREANKPGHLTAETEVPARVAAAPSVAKSAVEGVKPKVQHVVEADTAVKAPASPVDAPKRRGLFS